tara:strand:+ start:844 stop:1755 length:912 start_codon:yes stop_codon:yes gene_type:complete
MNYINLLILLFLIIIIFYLTFKNLVNVIEKKLNNIKIESPSVNVELPKDFIRDNIKDESVKYIVESKKYDNKTGNEIKNYKFDDSFKDNSDFILEGFDQYEKKNKEYNNKQKSSHICFDNPKNRKCKLGVMNYSDPKDLSEMDYRIFKLNYPPNMTMQDYVNWLYCYEDEEHLLPYNHLKNLYKLKKNIPLEEIKNICPPPGYENSPLEAEKYYEQLYNNNQEFKIASSLNSQTGPIMAYNNEDYGEFYQNFDVKGTSSEIRNCDIGLKKNVKELSEFISPQDSNNINDTNKYKKYYQKNVEL